MSHFPSGLWCDICFEPIVEGDWWHCAINGKPGHSCDKCKKEIESKPKTHPAAEEPGR
jgi:hypothetical protein